MRKEIISKSIQYFTLIVLTFIGIMIISLSRSSGFSFFFRFFSQAIGIFILAYLIKQFANKRQAKFGFVFILLFGAFPLTYHFIQSSDFYEKWIFELLICIFSLLFAWHFAKISIQKKIISAVLIVGFVFTSAFAMIPALVFKHQSNSEFKDVLLSINNTNSLVDENGMRFPSERFRDKVVLFEFWFHGCKPCIIKDKALTNIAERFSSNKDFMLVKINTGSADSYNYFKRKFIPEKGIISLHDENGALTEIMGINGYPTEYIVGKNGKVTSVYDGFGDDIVKMYTDRTIKTISELLKE